MSNYNLGPIKGACSLCSSGGDCVTGRKSIWNVSPDEKIETYLRTKNPNMFSLFKLAFKQLFNHDGNSHGVDDDDHFLHQLKSFMLHYK